MLKKYTHGIYRRYHNSSLGYSDDFFINYYNNDDAAVDDTTFDEDADDITVTSQQQQQDSGSSDLNIFYVYYMLSSVKSSALTKSTIYISCLVGLTWLYGAIGVLGFVSPTGKFIRPPLPKMKDPIQPQQLQYTYLEQTLRSNYPLHLGILLGLLIFLSCTMLLCAFTFSNIWVFDYRGNREKEAMPPYALEVMAQTFSMLCLLFTILFIVLAGVLFCCKDAIVKEFIREETEGRRKKSQKKRWVNNYDEDRPNYLGPIE